MKRTLVCSLVVLAVTLGFAGAGMAQDPCTPDPNVKVGSIPNKLKNPKVWYWEWIAGDPGDQSTVPGQVSGLVTWNNGRTVDDATFAKTTTAVINAGGAAYKKIPLVYVFGQCFGGGMIDDVHKERLGNPISIVTASFFNQRAVYPLKNGTGIDFTKAYTSALLNQKNPTAHSVAAEAAADDPWGWNPAAKRNGEAKGSELPEYYAQAAGGVTALLRNANEVNSVVLWAGQPEEEDDLQMASLLLTLVARGYKTDNITILFGGLMTRL